MSTDITSEHGLSWGWLGRHVLGWAIVVLFFVILGVGAANLLFTNHQVHSVAAVNTQLRAQNRQLQQQQAALARQVQANCHIWAHLSPLPVTVNITTGKPTLLSVQLISDFRVAWHAEGCDGTLAPPDPLFVKWALYYKLPVN